MGIFSWTTEAGETSGPAAPGYCCMALSSNATLSGLSAESLPDPGMSVPSTMAQNGCEMPPKPWSNWRPWGATLTGDGHRPLLLRRLNQGPLPLPAYSTAWKAQRRRSGTRPRTLEKMAEQAFRRLDVFREDFHEPRFLPLLTPWEALKSVTVTTALGFVIFLCW